MEKWITNIENMPDGNYPGGGDNEPANVVFCLDTRNIINAESFEATKSDIKAITEDAFEKYSDIKVYVYYQQFESNFTVTNKLLKDEKTGFDYFTSYEEAEVALNKIETYMIKSDFWAYDYVKATQFMIDTCDDNIIAMYHITADDRVMGSVDSAKKLTQTVQNSKYTTADKKEISRIYVSTLCPNSDKAFDTSSYAYKLAQISGGIAVSNYNATTETEVKDITSETVNVLASKAKSSKTSVSVSKNLIQILGEGNTSKYKVINSAGLNTINLKQKLTKGSAEDYDKDGITDWNEVNTRLIYSILARDSSSNVYSESTIAPSSLPTFADCRWYYSNSEEPKFYVEQGYEQFVNKNAAMYYNGDKEKVKEKLNKIRILPLISDPTKPDSDGDGLLDNAYKNPNAVKEEDKIPYDWVKASDKYFNISDPHPLKKEIIWQWPAYYSDGTTIDRLQSAFMEGRRGYQHNGIDITPTYGDRENCYVVAAYDGRIKNMAINNNEAGYFIEIEHNINGQKYISRYLHLEKFENSPLYKKFLANPNGTYVKSGDKIGIISGTPYGEWVKNEKGELVFIPNINGSSLRYPKHSHYTLSINSWNNAIDPLCFDVYKDNTSIPNPEMMFMKFSKNYLRKTCSDKCNSCKTYFEKVESKYKLDDTDWGV